jgi:hypothetical protein
MKLTHEKMLELTARMPMKQISIDCEKVAAINGGPPMPDGAFDEEWLGATTKYKMPYLHRYYAGTFKDGKDLWLHNFRSEDSERHLHSHPFEFETIMLVGNYTEDYKQSMDGEITSRYTSPCEWRSLDISFERLLQKLQSKIHEAAPDSKTMLGFAVEYRSVNVYEWHRITRTAPNTWTAVIVDPKRLPAWYFMDDDNYLEHVKSSPRKWHENYNCRPSDGVVNGENRIN